MLFKNNMRPAYATASDSGFAQNNSSRKSRFAVFSEGDSGDFGSFEESQSSRQRPTRTSSPRPQKPKGQKPAFDLSALPWKYIAIGAVAVVAVVVVIALFMGIILLAPSKHVKVEDNAYFVYSDTNGEYHVVSNGKTINHVFEGEVTITPAKDNSFAYVCDNLSGESGSGVRVYILKGNKLKDIEVKADELIAMADFEPGIVYKKNSRFHYYSSNDHTPITSEPSADDFAISSDGSTVIFTVDSSKNPGYTELKYFQNGGSETIGPDNFIPVDISGDGKYVYGINEDSGRLFFLTVKKSKAEIASITSDSHGVFGEITGMNADGDEIVFYTESEKGVVSFLYRVGDDSPTQIADGLFTPINADKEIACPDTFVNSYFVCEKDITTEDDVTTNATLTYFYDKNDGAIKLAETKGQFSPDCKYFYYVNEDSNLVRISLDSKNFEDSAKAVLNDVTDFAVISKGDVYVMLNDVNVGIIYHWDASTAKRTVITYDAKLGSMQLCANSVYFTEEIEGETKIYVSSEGAAKTEASFKNAALTTTPTMKMGVGQKGYAYFTDDNGNTMLFYTANGEKFSVVSSSCVISDAASNTPITPPSNSNNNDNNDEEEE